ncbi:carbohydrate ABC transporter substrate-binding protein, CUT1 family [Plantibacter flavus]|uniref:Carbohydrate ABC transporter substrate-binding protein (CUT1 family) n=1 Tax=Plantibacter flavus TaxID=150123 RepID=A0A3N2BYZ7_9MICO|nr:sugar ABC transporter substrate-binding protein [Plantibacter flavus]ROR80495.1 carbohydrate ABC transporter substrate-binding protein (CUT1 family) [Plantibacter flavus]SMG33908.1 carbohydrate ABC transporter substrate-binding protein, CUT1 family [Plantibacter flavus]
MKRPILTISAIAAAAGLALTGCSGAGSAQQDEDGPVTLSVSVWNYDQTPEFKALFDAFEAEHPDITIEPVDILADDYSDKVTTMLAGGDKTDVLTMKNVTDYARYANRGQLVDVGDVVDDIGADKLAGIEPFALDDTYYAAPYRQDFWLLYYNKAIFDAAGIEHPDNLTWDEYADIAAKLTSGDGDSKVYGTYNHYWRSVVQSIAAAQTGGDLISGDYGFMQDQYDLTLDLQEKGYALDYGTAKTQQISYRTMFETGKAAMMPMGTWYIAGIAQSIETGATDVDWGVAQMPQLKSGEETVTFGSPTAFAVNKNSTHQAAAKTFLEFAASEAGAKAIAAIGVVPAYQSDDVTAAFTALPTDDLSVKAFQEPKDVVLEMPVSEYSSDVSSILDEEHDLIMVGESKVDDAITKMQDRVKNDVLVD